MLELIDVSINVTFKIHFQSTYSTKILCKLYVLNIEICSSFSGHVSLSVTMGLTFGGVWLAFWWFVGIPILSVLLVLLVLGYLLAAVVFFALLGMYWKVLQYKFLARELSHKSTTTHFTKDNMAQAGNSKRYNWKTSSRGVVIFTYESCSMPVTSVLHDGWIDSRHWVATHTHARARTFAGLDLYCHLVTTPYHGWLGLLSIHTFYDTVIIIYIQKIVTMTYAVTLVL